MDTNLQSSYPFEGKEAEYNELFNKQNDIYQKLFYEEIDNGAIDEYLSNLSLDKPYEVEYISSLVNDIPAVKTALENLQKTRQKLVALDKTINPISIPEIDENDDLVNRDVIDLRRNIVNRKKELKKGLSDENGIF